MKKQENNKYLEVLDTLQTAFTDEPGKGVGTVMYGLSAIARELVQIKMDDTTNCPPICGQKSRIESVLTDID